MNLTLFAADQFDWPKLWVGLLGAAVSAVVTLFGLWLKRSRPTVIKCEEVATASLVDIAASVRSRLQITFDESPVKSLELYELEISNRGLDTINNIDLVLSFDSSARVLSCLSAPPESKCNTEITESNKVVLSIPYLNSSLFHSDYLYVLLLCDGPGDDLKILGRGAGWSVRHTKLAVTLKRRAYGLLIGVIVAFGWFVGVSYVAQEHFDVPAWEMTRQAAIASVIAFFPSAIVVFLTVRFFSTIERRTRRWKTRDGLPL